MPFLEEGLDRTPRIGLNIEKEEQFEHRISGLILKNERISLLQWTILRRFLRGSIKVNPKNLNAHRNAHFFAIKVILLKQRLPREIGAGVHMRLTCIRVETYKLFN